MVFDLRMAPLKLGEPKRLAALAFGVGTMLLGTVLGKKIPTWLSWMLYGAGITSIGMTVAGILNPVTVYQKQLYGSTNLTGRNVGDFSSRSLEAYGSTNLTGRNVGDFSSRNLEAYGAMPQIVGGTVHVPEMGMLQSGPGMITPVANPVTVDTMGSMTMQKQPGRGLFYGAGECPPGFMLNVATGECVPSGAYYGIGEKYDPSRDLPQAYGTADIYIRDAGETEFIGG
jgi:hypothetical protein